MKQTLLAVICLSCLLLPSPALSLSAAAAQSTNTFPHQAPAWRALEATTHNLSPAWVPTLLMMEAVWLDLEDLSLTLPYSLSEGTSTFLKTQKQSAQLLLDLIPAHYVPQACSSIVQALDSWNWQLTASLKELTITMQLLDAYDQDLATVPPLFQRSLTNADLSPELRIFIHDVSQIHGELSETIAQKRAQILPLHESAQRLSQNMQQAARTAEARLPDQWAALYFQPHLPSQLALSRASKDLKRMGNTLLDTQALPWQLPVIALLNSFMFIAFAIVFRMLSLARVRSKTETTQAYLLGDLLDSLSWQHKMALAVVIVVSTNFILDALPSVHIHIPYMMAMSLGIHLAAAVWARNRPEDPAPAMFFLPAAMGQLLMWAQAMSLWLAVFLGCTLLICLAFMLARPMDQRSGVFHAWFSLLILCTLLTLAGFARLATLFLSVGLFSFAGLAVLRRVYTLKKVRGYPLGLPLLITLSALLGCALIVIGPMGNPGIISLVKDWERNSLVILGLPLQAGQVVLLLTLALGLLAFSKISRQFLINISHGKSLLDSSAVPVIHTVLTSAFWVAFLLFALGILGMNISSLAFIGGALTVGLGFGLQSIISNFFSGLVLIFARVVRGGDLIEINGIKGWVRSVNMRATIVETADNALIFVPNVSMLNLHLTNWTKNNRYVCESLTLSMAPNCDVPLVRSTLETVAATYPGILPEPRPKAFLNDFNEKNVDFVLQVWVAEVAQRQETLSNLRCALRDTLINKGIRLSSPSLDVVVKDLCAKKPAR